MTCSLPSLDSFSRSDVASFLLEGAGSILAIVEGVLDVDTSRDNSRVSTSS